MSNFTLYSTKLKQFWQNCPLKRLLFGTFYLLFGATLFIIIIDQLVGFYVRDKIYSNIDEVPYRPYAVVLGTSKYTSKNAPNLFYTYRLQAVKSLFEHKKAEYILLSGDNRTPQYNEPRMMGRDLRKMGIDAQFLFPDYAGFRTLDSIIRAKEVFKVEPMTIISQRFHCERALFIAKYYQIDAICFVAQSPDIYALTRVREALARVLMLWELVTEKAPHFLGNPEPLPSR